MPFESSAPRALPLPVLDSAAAPATQLRQLLGAGHDRPPACPYPAAAAGATLARWQLLAAIGGHDLSLAKLFEGHTDALAILHEALLPAPDAGTIWGTWCAHSGGPGLLLREDGSGLRLHGRKSWCSGARTVSHALVSCSNAAGEARLAAVDMGQTGIGIDASTWQAVGMRDSASADVDFDGVAASVVGDADFYVQRPGFWHGGAGVAACWYGACASLLDSLLESLHDSPFRSLPDALLAQPHARAADPHRLTQLGEVAVTLQGAATLMRSTAAAIDAHPHADAMAAALTLRLAVEAAAGVTLAAVGRALGAGPLCKQRHIARLFADLPVFIRQSHAERDLAALGAALVANAASATIGKRPWTL
ncbi:acyl-CoA dehydrogenase [Massilia sp. PWRC2]|uniref:acyl-CoA dehydrogenase n=1 Tax=Massilia sp. PWRC2 TaxID=2804626 RepID=UPI003CECD7CB